MNKVVYIIVLVLSLVSCSDRENLKDTTWVFSGEGGSSILVFQDSTYTCTVKHDGVSDVQDGTYKYNEPLLQLKMNGEMLEVVIDGNELTTKDEYPLTFKKQ